jgi:HEAT repeat protein
MKKQGLKPGDNPFVQPSDKGIKTIDDALRDLNATEGLKRAGACRWLAKAPVDKGRQDEVAKALDPLLNNKDVRGSALNAVQVWATKDNVPALIKVVQDQNGPFVSDDQKQAMKILGQLQDGRGAACIVPYLANAFANVDASNALKAMGPVAEKDVLTYYKHGDGGVQARVRALLLGYGTKETTIALQLIEDAKTSTNKEDRYRVLDWLAKEVKPDDEVRPVVTSGLIALLKDSNPDVASGALKALGNWGNKDSVPAIIAVLDDPSPTDKAIELRRQAMDVLVKLRDERAVPAVAKRLTVEQERGHAAKCLKELAAVMMPMVEAELKKYVENDNKAVRDEAANLLKQMGSKENVAVTKAVKDLKANDAGQRQGAAQVLMDMPKADEGKKDEVAKTLVEALDDPDEVTRHRAAKALGTWGTADSIMPMIQKVPDQSERMRHNVMESLGKLKAQDAVDAIALRLNIDGDRSAASKALQAIGGPKAEVVGQKCLGLQNENLCIEGCRILQAIGTKNSLKILNQMGGVAVQAKKKNIVEAVQTAMQAINQRGV